ncbi:MAG: hypothetical protein K8J31_18810 [Anaerolineae bacterium]|nr:hypothetical protein [Anaerolineae bacterium]
MTAAKTNSLSAEDIKTRLSTLTAEELNSLRDTYDVRWRTSWLRSTGWLNVILGGLTLWLGLTCPCGFTVPKLIQALAGGLIVGQSVWAIMLPSTAGFLRFALVFLGAGIWNLLLALSEGFAGGAFLVGLLGVAQLRWANL